MKILPKITLSLLAISAVSAVVTVQLSGRAVRRALSEQTVAAASSHIRDTADACSKAVATGREDAILPFLQRLQFQTGAVYAQVLDGSGRILANTNVAMTGRLPKDAFLSKALSSGEALHEYSGEGRSRTVRIAVPVYSADPMSADELLIATGLAARERAGTIEAVISLDGVAGVESGLRGSHIYIALTSALLVFLGSFIFFRGGIFQLRRLSEGTDRITGGDYSVELPVTSRDELGELTANFNRMAQILSGTTVSKEYLHSLLENMLDPLFIADTEGRITRVNKAGAALMEGGGDRCSIYITDLLEPGESGAALSIEELRREGRVQILDMWFSPGSGKRVPVIAAAAYTAPYAGVKGSISVALKDLSESLAQKARIQEIQDNYRLVVESAPGAIFIQVDGRFEYLNPAALALFGARSETDLRGKSVRSMFPPDAHDSLRDILESGPDRADRAHNIEAECLRMDGTRFDAIISAVRYGTSGKNGALVFMMDMTDRKRTETELRNMQRIESIGVLAGGIAHDFNNMLTGVTANLSLLQGRGTGGPETQEVIRETMGAVSTAQNLTQQLLTFAKGGKPVKKPLDIGRLAADSAGFSVRGSRCKCRVDLAPGLQWASADEGQMKQVMNNIVMNAVQAMPDGGEITVRADNHSVRGPAEPGAVPPGEYVRITISDTGVGMSAGHLAKIFEPYFTTKTRGHGLGLAMVYSIVKNHGGHITAASEPGRGSTFVIHLPAEAVPPAEPRTRDLPGMTAPAGARVLVMDDDEIVRKAAGRLLAALGYDFLCVQEGGEALRRYSEAEAAGTPFFAIITDLTVPGGMGGTELVAEIRKKHPQAKVVVSSGYSDDPVMSDYRRNGFDAVLTKPNKFVYLRAVLDQLSGPAGREDGR